MIKNNINWISEDNSIVLHSYIQPKYADDYCEYKQFILENVRFTIILNHFKINFDICNSGKYTHRMVCPFRFHKNGRERTGSFRFHDKDGIFSCFGCNSGGNLLEFMFLFAGVGDEYNLRQMSIIGGLIKDGALLVPAEYISTLENYKPNNQDILFSIGVYLRNYLNALKDNSKYLKACEWVDKTLIRIDEHFALIGEENIDEANKIYEDLKKYISKGLQI